MGRSLPIDPRLGRMILEAERLGCVRDILVIAAALSLQDPRERPLEQQAQADQLGLDGGPLYDPLGNYRSVAGNWNDWAQAPRHVPVATTTATEAEQPQVLVSAPR